MAGKVSGMLRIKSPDDSTQALFTATLRPLSKGNDGVAQVRLSVGKNKDLLRLHPNARDGGAPPKNLPRPLPDWAKVRKELA